MTDERRKQIEEASQILIDSGAGPSDICHNCKVLQWAGFIHGAQWADANPSKSIFVIPEGITLKDLDKSWFIEVTKEKMKNAEQDMVKGLGLIDELSMKINILKHDHKIMKDFLETILNLEQKYPDGSVVASPASYLAEEVLSKIKVKHD